MANSNFLRGVGVVVLAIALMECGYRVFYWYWMSVSTPAEATVDLSHMHTWLTVTVILGLAWMYLSWKLLMEDRAVRKSKKTTGNAKKTQV